MADRSNIHARGTDSNSISSGNSQPSSHMNTKIAFNRAVDKVSSYHPESKKLTQDKEGNYFVVEQIEVSEAGSDFDPHIDYADIDDVDEIKASAGDLNNLDDLIRDVKGEAPGSDKREESPQVVEIKSVRREVVIDDFIRNFLVRHQMNQTLEMFQAEWYDLIKQGKITGKDLGSVPDVYFKMEKLEERYTNMQSELNQYKLNSEKAKHLSEKLRKERDFHKMHHSRVQQEKKTITNELEKLKTMTRTFDEKYTELSAKYETLMKDKMVLKLERDRLQAKCDSLQKSLNSLEEKFLRQDLTKSLDRFPENKLLSDKLPELSNSTSNLKSPGLKASRSTASLPTDTRHNPHLNQVYEPFNTKQQPTSRAFKKAHMMSISSLAVHPKKSIVATASDDLSWKIWTINNGELIMTGEGHKDWIAGIDFHPRGTMLATSSGDCTIRVWDFASIKAVHTFKDHAQPVWNIKFHDMGEYLISASMDHSCKVFDLVQGKAKMTLRGHVDSVNHIMFQPYTNSFASASADKTVSLWDIRSGLCTQTFYGHFNCVNHVNFNLKGDTLVSCDSDGVLKTWDIRMVKENYDSGTFAVNSCAFDRSGTILAAGTDEGLVKLFNTQTNNLELTLKGHEDAVQDVVFDLNSKSLITTGSDCSFIVWS